ncbi:Beta propeller domain-containing protein [Frankineae bacterium MT45]|nr:Beta propeller domain-containing protein [Frankineae bacterium MT45]
MAERGKDEDLSRRLRALRPDTAADHDWVSTPEADQALAAIHSRVDRGVTPSRRRSLAQGLTRRRTWLPAGALLAAAGVVAAVAIAANPPAATPSVGGEASGPSGNSLGLPAIRPAAKLLKTESSCQSLLADLRDRAAASVTPYGLPGLSGSFGNGYSGGGTEQLPSASDAIAATAQADTSDTNVQEVGVDEPDIVKADHGRVITITDGVLRVLDQTTGKITGRLDLTMYDGWSDATMLVDGDHALVILSSTSTANTYEGGLIVGAAVQPTSLRSTYLFVDLSAAPKVSGLLRASGDFLDARMVGSTVRLVVKSQPVLSFAPYNGGTAASLAANRKVIEDAPLSTWIPQYSLTLGSQTTEHTVPCSQISHPVDYTAASMLSIYTLDLTHLAAPPAPVTLAADGDTVYASSDSLYVTSNPAWNCCESRPAAVKADQTEIHRFDIAGNAPPTYLGSGQIPGRLLSAYSLSEYNGSLRIATTTDGSPAPLQTSIYVLNADTLATTGHVGGLGKNERLYAVRFLGPLAYVVTFRQVDPLYTVDLSNPAAPHVAGTLKITGYSDYLHDAGGGRLIGVGQAVSTRGQIAGVQISLFDVANPAAAKRTAQVALPNTPGWSTLDPHAFLYWRPTGLIVVPVQTWASGQSGKVLVVRAAGSALTTVGLLANPLTPGVPDDQLGIQRSLIANGDLWTVSGGGVQITNPATLARTAWIPFN